MSYIGAIYWCYILVPYVGAIYRCHYKNFKYHQLYLNIITILHHHISHCYISLSLSLYTCICVYTYIYIIIGPPDMVRVLYAYPLLLTPPSSSLPSLSSRSFIIFLIKTASRSRLEFSLFMDAIASKARAACSSCC